MEEMIILNGEKMPLKEYRKIMKAKNPKPTKKNTKKTYTEITILPSDIHYMMNQVKLIKSLSAYYDNGYRQWGTIAKRILNLKEIRTPFVSFRMKVREIDRMIVNINEISKKNSKDVYDFVRRFSYLLEDVSDCINELSNAVSKSGVISLHEKHECISGNGKRLGLKTLISRTFSATQELKKVIERCQSIADNH
jgi:hypothetical protein